MAEVDGYDIASIVLSVLAATLYATVAFVLSRRPVSQDAQLAQRGFIIWWGGLAGLGVYGIVFNPQWGIRVADHGLPMVLLQLYILFGGLMVLLWGLSFYMIYLYTGKRQLWVWPAAYFVLLMAFMAFLIHGFGGACLYPVDAGCVQPASWEEGDGATLGSGQERPAWVGPVFLIGLILPPLVAAVMYFMLFFRVRDATSRYRVAVVSGGIILWFGFSAVNSIISAADASGPSPVRGLVTQGLGLLAAALVLSAYFPPRFLQRRFGIERLALSEG